MFEELTDNITGETLGILHDEGSTIFAPGHHRSIRSIYHMVGFCARKDVEKGQRNDGREFVCKLAVVDIAASPAKNLDQWQNTKAL